MADPREREEAVDPRHLRMMAYVDDELPPEEREAFELVIPDAMDMDAGHISVASPLGRTLLDHKAGETVPVRLPAGTRKLKILKVVTLHQQVSDDA